MYCENIFCVYCNNNNCILNKISLDRQGMCRECIYPTIPAELLKEAKATMLSSFETQYLDWLSKKGR